jgi:hypothetical protein
VAVRTIDGATGSYTLQRVSRTITRTRVRVATRTAPGRAVSVGATVSPDAAGPVTFTVQHFDPLAGWLFFRQERARAVAGRATISFTPPTEGRWRVRAAFDGTRTAAPSRSGYAALLAAP